MKKWHKQWATCIILLILSGAFACVAEAFIQRFRAEELLRVLANTQLGAAQTPHLEAQLAAFRRYRSSEESSDGRSYDQFMFWNYGFALLHLAPAKHIWIQIDYENGVVARKTAHFAEAPNRGAILIEEADIEKKPLSSAQLASVAREVRERGSFAEPTYMLSVVDSASVPESRRRMDWTIDLACMTRPGSCGNLRNVLRGAFEIGGNSGK